MWNRLVEAVSRWLGRTSKRSVSDATLLRPRGNEITFAVRVKSRRKGNQVHLGDVEQDMEFGPKWADADDMHLHEVMHRAGVYALTIALVGRIHQMEDYHGTRIYSTIIEAMNNYYFDTDSLPETDD
jgi:hypothetical protein